MREGKHSDAFYALLKKIPKQSRSRNLVEAVVIAAADELARTRDEQGLSLKQISERAGVAVASLYDYFMDRESVLAGVAAKITDDNLATFEAALDRTRTLPLREALELITDHAFERFAGDRPFLRTVMRLAYQLGMMSAITDTTRKFAGALADAMRERADVRAVDHDAASYVLTMGLLGITHALVWDDAPPATYAKLREEWVTLALGYLARDPKEAA